MFFDLLLIQVSAISPVTLSARETNGHFKFEGAFCAREEVTKFLNGNH